ncbi:unnamed protein product [Allacma fusca]|uniref:PKS/mFAS DH domain-containing protein n=1 Tax=Allacma fusca TaxID=39272 RepID=A0A8J2PXP8_9HEXA|nr:unnamed protein product [Allacma fusca]
MGVETKLSINLTSDEAFSGHVLKERIIFPATGYIWLVWKTFARLHSANPEEFPIHLENINFKRITELFPKNKTDFNINILKQSGDFEIVESSEIVCNGTIRQANKANREMLVTTPFENENEETFDLQDFYRFLHLKGYSYKGLFRGVQNIEFDGKWAKLAWNENWICFLDAMLQTWILGLGSFWNELAIPVRLQAATIDPILFRKTLTTDTSTVVIKYCKYTQVVQCPGIRLGGLITSAILLHKSPILPTITVQKFSPYIYSHPATVSKEAALEFFIGIVVDNSYGVSKDPFVFTEILTECKPTELNLQSLLYLKFLSFEHRVVQTKRYKHIEEEATLTNCQHFESIKEMELLAPNHLIKTESEGDIPACAEIKLDLGTDIAKRMLSTSRISFLPSTQNSRNLMTNIQHFTKNKWNAFLNRIIRGPSRHADRHKVTADYNIKFKLLTLG